MTIQNIYKAKDPGMRSAMKALRRASLEARETAKQTKTAIVVVESGKIVRLTGAKLSSPRARSQQS